MMHCINGVGFQQNTPERSITVTFLRKMLSSAETILRIEPNGYDSCIIASHMTEGILLLNWLLDDPARIKDYDDYIFVEFLPLLEIDPSFRESLLETIKQNDIQRFMKAEYLRQNEISDDLLLNYQNYRNDWYKPEINTLKDIPKCVKQKVTQKALNDIYAMYHGLCSYKHYSPCVMPSKDDMTNRWRIRAIDIALKTAALCLYIILLYTNQFQNNILDANDIIQRYDKLP